MAILAAKSRPRKCSLKNADIMQVRRTMFYSIKVNTTE